MHPQSPEPTPPESGPALDAAAAAEMERALLSLPLHEPSTALDARVAAALADASTAPADEPAAATDAIPFPGPAARRSRWLTGLAAAAVVALLTAVGLTAYFQPGQTAPSPDGPGVVEVEPDPVIPQVGPGGTDAQDTTQPPGIVRAGYNFQEEPVQLHWTRDLDAGTLTAADTQPVRAVRRQDVEQRVWVDAERGVTVQVTRPRERLMVVKQPTF